MSDIVQKCAVCGALLDEEDIFCPNCGREAPARAAETSGGATSNVVSFSCQGCGASMSYDAAVGTLRCPFCGSERLTEQEQHSSLVATSGLPFRVPRKEAMAVMRRWLGSSFWRPGDLATSAVVTRMAKVYVPYWVFRGTAHTHWTADSSCVPCGARGNWAPVTGEHDGDYDGLLIGASSALTPAETAALCPFDLTSAVAADQLDREGTVTEEFRVPRKYARPLARTQFEELERRACAQSVPGRSRNVKVNVQLRNLAGDAMLVPVWITAYTYRDRVFRFLMNGQSGRTTGTAPLSKRKIAAVVAMAIMVLAGAALLLRLLHN